MASRIKALGLFTAGGLTTYGILETLKSSDWTASTWPKSTFISLPLKKKFDDQPVQDVLDSSSIVTSDYSSAICSSTTKLNQWRTANQIPGYVLGVSIKGQNVWTIGDGYADIENGIRCNPDTVMRIASISKSITAALLGKMLQEKTIDLDKPIREYLTVDQWPDKYWEGEKVDITLRQLVSHLGGIRHYKKPEAGSGEFDSMEYYLNKRFPNVVESLSIFKDDPLVAKPGTKYVYTTFGWTLISAAMETQLKEKNFTKALTKFFSELGMSHTYLDENLPIIYNRARYYMIDPKTGKLTNVPAVDNSYKWAGGGLLSTVGDLLRFGNMMLYSFKGADPSGRPGYLQKTIVNEMWTPAEVTKAEKAFGGYGIGWAVIRDATPKAAFTAEPRFTTLISHAGGAVGASSLLLIDPQNEIVLALIINLQQARELNRIGYDVMESFLKQYRKLSGQVGDNGNKVPIQLEMAM